MKFTKKQHKLKKKSGITWKTSYKLARNSGKTSNNYQKIIGKPPTNKQTININPHKTSTKKQRKLPENQEKFRTPATN